MCRLASSLDGLRSWLVNTYFHKGVAGRLSVPKFETNYVTPT